MGWGLCGPLGDRGMGSGGPFHSTPNYRARALQVLPGRHASLSELSR